MCIHRSDLPPTNGNNNSVLRISKKYEIIHMLNEVKGSNKKEYSWSIYIYISTAFISSFLVVASLEFVYAGLA